MCDVCRVVDAEADGDDDYDAGDDVDGQTPEVHEAHHVNLNFWQHDFKVGLKWDHELNLKWRHIIFTNFSTPLPASKAS